MRSMRCESCGTKALMAASQCPKCGHGFEVRDGFGDMLPLSHCSACDAFYPAKLGSCKWCGTQPERAPIGPYVWKGVGVAAFLAMAWGAWLVHDDPPADVSAKRMQAMLKPDSTAVADTATTPAIIASTGSVDSVPAATDVVVPDTSGGIPLTIVAKIDTVSVSATVVVPASEPVAAADSAPAPEPDPLPREVTPAPARSTERPPARVATGSSSRAPASATKAPRAKPTTKTPSRAVASAKTPPKSAAKTVAKAPVKRSTKTVAAAPKAKSKTRWVNSIARSWVVVRASASPQSRIIASIGPNTRVQLGESRGGWRRIKAKGLAGWVEHRSFFAGTSGSRSTSRLAAR